MAEQLIFELNEAYFCYPGKLPALCGINLAIEKGEIISVIGANGTGKSTLLHMLDGLIFPDKGSIKAFGRQLGAQIFNDEEFSGYFRGMVGLVFQNPDIQLFCPTVKEDISFGPLHLGVARDEVRRRLEELLDRLSIRGLEERSPHQLSVGEKKKVAIASVLAMEPEVLILDEPTAGLDPDTCRELIELIQDFHGQGKTVITATHDLHIVPEISDKVYILSRARTITACGKAEEILSNEALLESHNLLHAHKHKHAQSWHKHQHQHPFCSDNGHS